MKSLLFALALLSLCAGCHHSLTDDKLNQLAMSAAAKGFEACQSGEDYASFSNRFWVHIQTP